MKQKLLVGALIIAGLASIAYAAFSQSLVINGSATTTADWNVKITGITNTASNGAVQVNGSPTFTDTSATFDAELAFPGSSATYEVVIANQGNIDAELSSITGLDVANAASPTDIQYTLTGVSNGELLAAGSTATAIVTVEWNANSTLTTSSSKTAQLTFNYVQSTP